MLTKKMDNQALPSPVEFGIFGEYGPRACISICLKRLYCSLLCEIHCCLSASHGHCLEGVSENISLQVSSLLQPTVSLSHHPVLTPGWLGGGWGLLGGLWRLLMLCSLVGHGHGHDDRVLPLHIHHSGNVPPRPGGAGGGAPSEHGQTGGDSAAARGDPGWTCLPKAVGVAPSKNTEMCWWPAHLEK